MAADSTLTAAIVVGVIVGIAFVLSFAIAMDSTDSSAILFPTTKHISLEIVGLKDRYGVGEPIHFQFKVSGYGYYCQSPNAAIWNASLFLKSLPVWRSGLPTVFCVQTGIEPPYHYIADTYDWSSYQNIAMKAPGNYTLGIRFEDRPIVTQNFTVTS